jgi:hypothetical protein
MNRILLLACCGCLPLGSIAQLQAPDVSAVGSYVLRAGAYTAPGFQGAGATWDFSELQPQGAAVTRTLQPVAQHPLAKSFGGAQWWIVENGTDLFYSWDGAFVYHGGLQGNMVVAYSDPETYHPYPFALGDVHSDALACTYGAGGVTVVRSGTVSSACVGQGTLTLPGGSVWENVYRVDMQEEIVDHTSVGDYEIMIDGSYFYHADHSSPLVGLVLVTTIDDTAGGGEPVVTEQAFAVWVQSFALDVEEGGVSDASAQRGVVMPNPTRAGGQVMVVWPAGGAPSTLEIWNPAGVRVHQQRVAPGVPSVSWDASGWPPGIYLVRGVDTGEVLRWVIE